MIDAVDRRLIEATQSGLPLTTEPYAEIADKLGLQEDDVLARLSKMQTCGIIRRIAIAPNHYALGMTANGMTVWNIKDHLAMELGSRIGGLSYVSHCYLRPRALPDWPYNLFAMVHGNDRTEVEEKRQKIASLLGEACKQSDILYSNRILKKTGLRLVRNAPSAHHPKGQS